MTTAAEDEIRSRVRGRLSLIRWRHTLGVAETAEGPLPVAAPFYRERFGGL